MTTLYLIRGIPGSGKSTLAKKLCTHVIEADDYFYDDDGNYHFDPDNLQEAHKDCFKRACELIDKGEPLAVSNTSVREWEFKKYLDYAANSKYVVHSIIVENRHKGNSTHGVPPHKIKQMRDVFDIKL